MAIRILEFLDVRASEGDVEHMTITVWWDTSRVITKEDQPDRSDPRAVITRRISGPWADVGERDEDGSPLPGFVPGTMPGMSEEERRVAFRDRVLAEAQELAQSSAAEADRVTAFEGDYEINRRGALRRVGR